MEKWDEVIFAEHNNKGTIILNRNVFNALTLSMVRKIEAICKIWESEKSLVVIKANRNKFFCSGENFILVLTSIIFLVLGQAVYL